MCYTDTIQVPWLGEAGAKVKEPRVKTITEGEEYLNHWVLTGRVIEPPQHFTRLGSEPPSLRCKVADLGDEDNHIVLRWDNPEDWQGVEEQLHTGDLLYVEGALQFSRFRVNRGTEHRSLLMCVVRRWQYNPPPNSVNELTLVGKLKGDPRTDTTGTGRRIASLRVTWPDERKGIDTSLVYAYLYDDLASEAALSMVDGDMVFVVGVARKDVQKRDGEYIDKHRVIVHTFEAGLGIENEARVWEAQLREGYNAGVIS
jgi:single-stranded DNA-binding protein